MVQLQFLNKTANKKLFTILLLIFWFRYVFLWCIILFYHYCSLFVTLNIKYTIKVVLYIHIIDTTIWIGGAYEEGQWKWITESCPFEESFRNTRQCLTLYDGIYSWSMHERETLHMWIRNYLKKLLKLGKISVAVKQ